MWRSPRAYAEVRRAEEQQAHKPWTWVDTMTGPARRQSVENSSAFRARLGAKICAPIDDSGRTFSLCDLSG
jgi:hypothetical protein